MNYSALIEKGNKHCKIIDTNHLIVLCEVGENYKSFCDDLEKLIKSKNSIDLVSKVFQIMMREKLPICSNKYKEFIKKHKQTIEIMKKYHCLINLTVLSYDTKGKRREDLAEDYFYQYIQEHKEDIEIIKAVALKIKALGFKEINFGEKLDFTGIEYELGASYRTDYAFLENMEVIPTYLSKPIKYRTNGSCYCLILNFKEYGSTQEISEFDRSIELNSLIFDPNKLPNEITFESTIGIIQKLAEMKKGESGDIRDSVDLNMTTGDLTNYFERLKEVSARIDKIKDNQELNNLLNQMQNTLLQLNLFGVNFESQVIASHPGITDETMKREKRLYLDRMS